MRFITTAILILLIMSQAFSQWFVVAVFKVNQSTIARKTCENRYRPKMNCKGSCMLMKKMKQQEKEDQNAPCPLKLEFSTLVLSSRSFFATSLPISFNTHKLSFPVFNTGKPVDMPFAVFHPPQTC